MIFRSCYLRNTVWRAITAINSDFSDESERSKPKSWKGFSILEAVKNICASWEEGNPATLTGVRKLIPGPPPDGFEGFKTSVEEVAVVETARELDGEPGDAIELRPSRGKARTDEESLLTDARRRCFFFFF